MSPAVVSAYAKQVGNWRLSKDILGTGTTSTVVLSTHAKLPTLCAAVKVISRRSLLVKADADPTAVHLADAVIYKEVILMKLAAHERIVRLYDFASAGDMVYIIMEHAPHKTLLDLFRTCPTYVPYPLVVHIFSQFMQGLAHAHSLHIVHRDLKLENVFIFDLDMKTLLCDNPADFTAINIKIGDFGLAHVDDSERLSTVFHGSPHYQAPEVWARVPHHALPTDIWSAGVMLYALLCRRLPFDLASLRATNPPPSPSESEQGEDISEPHMPYDVLKSLSDPADELLKKLFAIDPVARPTAQEVLLDPFFDGVPVGKGPALSDNHEYVPDPLDFYDLATLCIPPGRHIPRDTFPGSQLEHTVQERLLPTSGERIEKKWAQKLAAYTWDKGHWEEDVRKQVADKENKERMRSLGRKTKTADVLGPKEMNFMMPTRFTASLSFRNLFVKATPKAKYDSDVAPLPPPPPPPTRSPSPLLASSGCSTAETLQDRREALLRCAQELGFGTRELREFADEAGRIVRVAQEGDGKMGLKEIAREVERRAASDVHPAPDGSFCMNIGGSNMGDDTPDLGEDSPNAGDDNPITRSNSHITGDDSPIMDDGSPVTDDGSPITDDGSPITDDGSPIMDGSPITDDGGPNTPSNSPNMGGKPQDLPFHRLVVTPCTSAAPTLVSGNVVSVCGKSLELPNTTMPAMKIVTQEGGSEGYICFGI